MTPTEFAAYIGAAAWLPQIIRFFSRWLTKPKLKLISGPTVEIGYTTFGPIINLTTSISVERRDALINKITLNAIHEKGDTRKFTWKWLNEIQHQIRNVEGETAEVSKNQPAVAVKVSTLSLTEKQIGFQDLEYQSETQKINTKMDEQIKYYKEKGDDPVESLLNSKEFFEARDFFKNSMYWKQGKYIFEVNIQEIRLSTPHKESFSLVLSKDDIEKLQKNTDQLETYLRLLLETNKGKGKDLPSPSWNWRTPEITPSL